MDMWISQVGGLGFALPKFRGTMMALTIIATIVFWALYRVPPFLGNPQKSFPSSRDVSYLSFRCVAKSLERVGFMLERPRNEPDFEWLAILITTLLAPSNYNLKPQTLNMSHLALCQPT